MSTAVPLAPAALSQVLAVVREHWGFESLRPLQAEAIAAALAHQDALVVMPTGGGKSLCYQVPPAIDGATDVVVSPLIALMKDQVDGLRESGYPAAALHSGMAPDARRQVERELTAGNLRLVFVAPERLVTDWFLGLARRLSVRRFAIDEAHCISQWGHDFRPEYRQLAILREQFPEASLHAFTATATPRVRDDILAQLRLREPAVLVGRFDRPNLVYRVIPQVDLYRQTVEVVRRHRDEAVIVYCLSRKDTEAMAATLAANGVKAAAYHAGLESDQRHRTQEAFAEEKLDVVVATVAFGMGIDRSNVRCVLHAAMPKSLEHYQQETGRAGRDGLEAECVLLYSASDVIRWESLIAMSAEKAADPEPVIAAQTRLLQQMRRYCNTPACRHKLLSEHFGQAYEQANCGACDACLGEVEGFEDATVTAQKILSCVARTGQRFGIGHVVEVLQGADTDMIRRCRHEMLSTYGLLKDVPKKELTAMVYQLVDQGLLVRTAGDRPVVMLNDESWAVMRGQRAVHLVRPKQKAPTKTRFEAQSWEGADRGLFEHLRQWRKRLAEQRSLPPFVIFHDNTLLALAKVRPTRLDTLRHVPGIGARKTADLGAELLRLIAEYCQQHQLTTDAAPAATGAPGGSGGPGPASATDITIVRPANRSAARQAAFSMFAAGQALDAVAAATDRARSTVAQYLVEYLAEQRPATLEPWVDAATYQQVLAAARTLGEPRLTPLFEHLGGQVPYDSIRLVLAHLRMREGDDGAGTGG